MDPPNRTKKYQYTKNNLYLTEEQRDFYEVNGYLIVRKLVDYSLLDECGKRFIDICNGTVDPGFMSVMKDVSLKSKGIKGEFLINRIQDFKNDDIFMKYVSYKPIIDIVESIIGPDITNFHSMIINKPPNSEKDASRHPLHQDLHYMPFRPANSIVAAWTAMEKIDENNGCLFVIPGSHKWKLFKHDYPPNVVNPAFHGVYGFEEIPTINLVMEKGDTVFFHPIILHGSGPNVTKGFRKAISCHYADSNCDFIDVTGSPQENIAREVEQIAKKKGVFMSFGSIWKFKSTLIRGKPGNFQTLDSHL